MPSITKPSAGRKKKLAASPAVSNGRSRNQGSRKERILIEFPTALLTRADAAARELDKNRSELIRTAVERLLEQLETAEFNRELADAYSANAELNLTLLDEFAHADQEGF
jgi:hypothetical protein